MKSFQFAIYIVFLSAAYAWSTGKGEFQVYVFQSSKTPSCEKITQVPSQAEVLFSGKDVASFSLKDQTFLMNPEATSRLMQNASDLEDESQPDFVPRGRFFEIEGHSFAVVLKGEILASGIVAGMSMLEKPPACTLLYPALPMVQNGGLAIAVGLPNSEMELGEDFFTVLIEEGPSNCFKPVFGPELSKFFTE
jgi:hypothetical protein